MQVATMDSTAVATVYGRKHDSEDTLSLHVRRLNASFMECQEKEAGLQVYMHV